MVWFDNLEALRDWADNARPVFICGQERSGTSALQLAMARHPSLFGVPHVFETFVFREPRDLLSNQPRAMQQSYLRGADNLAALRGHLVQLAASEGGDASTLHDDDLIRAFFAFAAHHVYPGLRPLEKTPAHVHSLPRMFSIFPRARVLACVREPTEVVDSYRHRLAREQAAGKPEEAWGWLDKSNLELIRQFRRVDRALRDAATTVAPGQVFQVPYTWLIEDAEQALVSICEFIGEPFAPAMLSPKAGRSDRIDTRLGRPIAAAETTEPSTLSKDDDAMLRKETWGLTRRWRVPGVIPPDPPGGA